MTDVPYIETMIVEFCRIVDRAEVSEVREVTSVAPCRPARAGQWERCDRWVERSKVNPKFISSLRPHLRDAFLRSCATDSRGNAWTPKWCVQHTRESLELAEREQLALFPSKPE